MHILTHACVCMCGHVKEMWPSQKGQWQKTAKWNDSPLFPSKSKGEKTVFFPGRQKKYLFSWTTLGITLFKVPSCELPTRELIFNLVKAKTWSNYEGTTVTYFDLNHIWQVFKSLHCSIRRPCYSVPTVIGIPGASLLLQPQMAGQEKSGSSLTSLQS